MTLPTQIEKKIEELLSVLDTEIEARIKTQNTFEDFSRIKEELIEIKSGIRKTTTPELNRMMIDCMDWDKPYFKQFNELLALLHNHYKLR